MQKIYESMHAPIVIFATRCDMQIKSKNVYRSVEQQRLGMVMQIAYNSSILNISRCSLLILFSGLSSTAGTRIPSGSRNDPLVFSQLPKYHCCFAPRCSRSNLVYFAQVRAKGRV